MYLNMTRPRWTKVQDRLKRVYMPYFRDSKESRLTGSEGAAQFIVYVMACSCAEVRNKPYAESDLMSIQSFSFLHLGILM